MNGLDGMIGGGATDAGPMPAKWRLTGASAIIKG